MQQKTTKKPIFIAQKNAIFYAFHVPNPRPNGYYGDPFTQGPSTNLIQGNPGEADISGAAATTTIHH